MTSKRFLSEWQIRLCNERQAALHVFMATQHAPKDAKRFAHRSESVGNLKPMVGSSTHSIKGKHFMNMGEN